MSNENYSETTAIDPNTWKVILHHIKTGKCLLILGAELEQEKSKDLTALTEEKTVNSQLIDYLNKYGYKHKYYPEDGFFGFESANSKLQASFELKEIHNRQPVTDFYRMIAEIPFRLIISLSPGDVLGRAYEELGYDHSFNFYSQHNTVQEFEIPKRNKPAIYNIFGSTSSEESLILTYDDIFSYLFNIIGSRKLNGDLKNEIESAKLVLFVGFQYEKWYCRLISRLLDVDKKMNHAPINNAISNEILNFYTDEFKVKFLPISTYDIIKQIHTSCKQSKFLRKQFMVCVSYKWNSPGERVVEELCKKANEEEIEIRRDRTHLEFGDDITEFARKIGKANIIVVVICQKYLESEFCMRELNQIRLNGRFEERIIPMVLESVQLHDAAKRTEYAQFWKTKTAETDEKAQEYQEFCTTIENTKAWSEKKVTTNPDLCSKDVKIVVDRIKSEIETNG